MPEPVHVAQPLQGVLRHVGQFGAADEPFEQTDPRREDFFFLADGAFDGDPEMRQAAVGRPPVALSRAGCADGYECGSWRRRTGAERGGRRFQQ